MSPHPLGLLEVIHTSGQRVFGVFEETLMLVLRFGLMKSDAGLATALGHLLRRSSQRVPSALS